MDGMKQMKAIDFGYEDLYSDDIINRYEQFYHHAVTQLQILEQEDESIAICVESALLNKWLAKTEEHVIDDLLKKEIITEKLHSLFMDEVDSEVWKTY